MKAILIELTFYEAFFKVHYTKGFRLSYPMPLPTSVAGIFGAMLGIDRREIENEFGNLYFGAGLLRYDGTIIENETFIQYKTAQVIKGTVRTHIINHPSYLIAVAGPEEKMARYYNFLKNHIFVYLPYGGQNDFFVENIEVKGLTEVRRGEVVSNYAPQDIVERFESKRVVFSILPVMHTYSDNPNFYFVLKGNMRLKKPVEVAGSDNIALYPLEMFKLVYR